MLKKLLTFAALLYAACAFAALDANQASKTELSSIKGIGPALADRIVAQRKKNPFTDWTDLVNRVHGVGQASAAKLSAGGLTVNGRHYPGTPAPQAAQLPAAPPSTTDKSPPPQSRP